MRKIGKWSISEKFGIPQQKSVGDVKTEENVNILENM